MLAAVYHGPNDLRLERRPVPALGPEEALLKVVGAGLCGTDLRILHGVHRKYPAGTVRIPGHEIAGEIAQVGANVRGLEAGQRVFVAPNIGCGHCRQCVSGNNNRCPNYDAFGITIDGAFAEYMRIPASAILQGNLIPLENDAVVSAAALIEPLACVLRGQDVLEIQPDDIVLVMGAGPIGIMHIMLGRLRGVSRVIVADVRPERLPWAVEAGADRVISMLEENLAAVVSEETQGQGADVIIVATPAHRAQEEALELAAIGGRLNFFGGLPKDQPTIQFDSNLMHYKELRVTGTTACSTSDCRRATAIVNAGRMNLAKLVSDRFPLDQAVEAFARADGQNAIKVMLEP